MKRSILKCKISALILTIIISTAGFYGCSDTVTNPADTDNLRFSALSSTDSTGDYQTILVLDTVTLLIKDIKLNVSNNHQDSTNFKT